MALIKCPECGKEFSSAAAACPNCAYPVNKPSEGVQVVEATGKKWKLLQLAGGVAICLGFAGCVFGAAISDDPGGPGMAIAWGFFMIGVAAYIGGRCGAWWHHK